MTGPKTVLILLFLFLTGISAVKCQVFGISGSKLNTTCTRIVDFHSLEFEVLYAFEKSHSRWDHEGSLVPFTVYSQQPSVSSDLQFRVTFGLFRNAELGATVNSETEEASLGFKWMPFTFGKSSTAIAGGMRFFMGEISGLFPSGEGTVEKTVSGALIYSLEITPSISFDLNAAYNMSLYEGVGLSSGCLDLCGDLGWYLFDGKLQAVIGGGLQAGSMAPDQEKFRIVTLYPGITVRTGRDYEILIALPRDINGINQPKKNSVMCALTVTLH